VAKKIKFDQVEDYLTSLGNFFAQSTVFEADRSLKTASPAVTGRLRASWQIGENAANGNPKPPGEYGDAQGDSIPDPEGINYQPGTETIGNVYSVHNNLEYAEPVCMGTGLPASWGGQFRTREATLPGFPEIITKKLQVDSQKRFNDAVKQAQTKGKF